MEKIFYQSSMPRSGSTLFQNIVGQNPDFYVTPTSGLINLVMGAKHNYTNTPEFKAVSRDITKEPFLEFCKEGINGYCNSITDKSYVLDKSRGWGINYKFLEDIFKESPKIVCVVRDLRDIIASMESKFRNSTTIDSGVSDSSKLIGTTVEKRTQHWLSGVPVGISLDWLKDIIQRGLAGNILFIRYEDLLASPNEQMNKFYQYIDLPTFEHDFNNIKQITDENDEIHGIYGDHKIKEGQLCKYESKFDKVLTQDSINIIQQNYKWYFDFFGYNIVNNG